MIYESENPSSYLLLPYAFKSTLNTLSTKRACDLGIYTVHSWMVQPPELWWAPPQHNQFHQQKHRFFKPLQLAFLTLIGLVEGNMVHCVKQGIQLPKKTDNLCG